MERSEYFLNNQTHTLLQSFPEGSSSDDVRISIFDVDDNNLDTNLSAMSSVTGNTFSFSWAVTQANTYSIDFYNATLDVHHYLNARVTGTIIGSPSGSSQGSQMSTLRENFLLSIDNYNADDLTGTNSAGDQAVRAINQGLQLIYSLIKDSHYMQSNPSTSLASTSGQDFINLSGISDIDEILSLTETVNDVKLTKISFWRYRSANPDPSNATGVPTHYARLFDRIYLFPRPDSAITYVADYHKRIDDLSSTTDRAGVPSKFNYWIFAEARVFWQIMEDRTDVASLNMLQAHAERIRATALNDVFAEFDMSLGSDAHFLTDEEIVPRVRRFDSPIGS